MFSLPFFELPVGKRTPSLFFGEALGGGLGSFESFAVGGGDELGEGSRGLGLSAMEGEGVVGGSGGFGTTAMEGGGVVGVSGRCGTSTMEREGGGGGSEGFGTPTMERAGDGGGSEGFGTTAIGGGSAGRGSGLFWMFALEARFLCELMPRLIRSVKMTKRIGNGSKTNFVCCRKISPRAD